MAAKIMENEYGIISVDKDVLSSIAIRKMMAMDTLLIPCNKKGKTSRKNLFHDDENESSVEIRINNKNEITVKLYFIAQFGESINQMAKELFDSIEEGYAELGVAKPKRMTACIKGVIAKQLADRNIEVVRRND